MSRLVETGAPVADHFSAFEDDGYSKRSGLTAGDFTATVYKDGALAPTVVVTITEIGTTGEYKVAFTLSATGFYSVQALIGFSKEIWEGEYTAGATLDSVTLLLEQIMNKDGGGAFDPSTDSLEAIRDLLEVDLSRILGLLHYNAIVDKQTYDVNGQLTGARLRVFTDETKVPSVPGGTETDGLVQEYVIEAQFGGVGVLQKYSLKKVL